MAYNFNMTPREVPAVKTAHRCIQTKIPVPESLDYLERITARESSNVRDQLPVIWDHAKDYQVFDPWGNCWIDFTSTIFVTNAGHGCPQVVKRLKEWIDKPLLHAYSYTTPIRCDFVDKILDFTPDYLEKVSLFSTGTEASERAIKLCRLWGQTFTPHRKVLVGGVGNFHGKTLGAQMIGGQADGKKWIGNLDPDMVHMPFPFPWDEDLKTLGGAGLFQKHLDDLAAQGVDLDAIAAFFVESFQGWAAIFYPKEYIQAMRAWTREHDALLVFDEVQAGFGRTGRLFAYERYEVEPDLVICGKAMSSSLPLSAVLGRAEVIELDPAYTSTHGGHPLACAAGLGNLEAYEEMDLINRSQARDELFRNELLRWREKFPERVGAVYGYGSLFGVFVTKPGAPSTPEGVDVDFTDRIIERAMEKGVFSIRTGRGSIKLGPPLTIPDEALLEGLKVYEECFEELLK